MVTYKRYDALNLAVSEIEKLGGTESYPTPDEYTNASYSMLKKIPLNPIDVPRSIPAGSTMVNQLAEPVVQILNELNNTFKRAFDLCVLKINSINTGRVTSTNILISILALIVSLLSLFVAIKHPS
jgi:hypothetical protein